VVIGGRIGGRIAGTAARSFSCPSGHRSRAGDCGDLSIDGIPTIELTDDYEPPDKARPAWQHRGHIHCVQPV